MPNTDTPTPPPFCWCPIDGGVGHFWHDTTCPAEPVEQIGATPA